MAPSRLARRLRYAFDNTMARGPVAVIGWLALVVLAIITLAAGLIALLGLSQEDGAPIGFLEAAWESLMRTFDPGTMGGDTGWGFRLVMLSVTLGGIFVMSTLIGLLTAAIEDRLQELRKGRSAVVEADHTVILGWSEQIYTIISELSQANASRRRACVVVLAEKDKVEMEDALRERLPATGNTRVVCRTGSPIEASDLQIASLDTARAVIVLSPDDDDPDAQVIKTLLAIVHHPHRRAAPYHIVAEIRDERNVDVARYAGGSEVELVVASSIVARIVAQTCRQSGLSVVYTELINFAGDEIYLAAQPALAGKTFGEALLAYEDSTVVGLQPAGQPPQLNPDMQTLIGPDDQIVFIAEDDSTIRLSGRTQFDVQQALIEASAEEPLGPERTLILGWNRRAARVVTELAQYVASGSELTVVGDCAELEAEVEACRSECANLAITCLQRDTTSRRTLDQLAVETYQHVVVLCYDNLAPQEADARTLIALLHLRDIAEHLEHPFTIVSEMLDMRNRRLAEVTRADDFVVSGELISLILAQVAENKGLNALFADIFDPEDSEIYLKPAARYVRLGAPTNFYTVVVAARQLGEVAMGYRLHAHASDYEHAYGVVVNPMKSESVTFGPEDKIIVVARH